MNNGEVIICKRCGIRYLGNHCPLCNSDEQDIKGVDKFDNDYTDLGLE